MNDVATSTPLDERPFFFARGAARQFGLLHMPAGAPSALGFVMSHPFAEEKLWSHRVYVSFARALAARGHAVLRFDYQGAGDSSGMTQDTSLASHLDDLAAAVTELRARVSAVTRIGLVGLRLGASFAALLAARAATDEALAALRAGPLVLWDPVLDGDTYFQELLRSNLSTQLAVYGKVQETREVLADRLRAGGTVNVDGYELGRELFEACSKTDLLAGVLAGRSAPTLVMQIAANEKAKDRDDLRAFAAGIGPNATFARAIEHPFWREIKPFYGRAEALQGATLEWLEKLDV